MSFPYESGISLCCTIYVPCLATEKKNTCCLLLILLRLIQVAHSEFSSTYHGCYSSFSKAKTARAQILLRSTLLHEAGFGSPITTDGKEQKEKGNL